MTKKEVYDTSGFWVCAGDVYVSEEKMLHMEFAQFLDWLLAMHENDVEEMVSIKDRSKLQHKNIIRMAAKVVNKYKLNPNDYPAVFDAKKIASLSRAGEH